MITQFMGPTRWLSNFAVVTIEYEGVTYFSTEVAYQASKTLNIKARRAMARLATPGGARHVGGVLQLRPDWDEVKLKVMEDITRLKFSQEPYCSQLLATGDEQLIEGNNWGDTFWGVCKGKGENNLGKIIMKIRNESRRMV